MTKKNFSDVELTTKAIIAFEYFAQIDASASVKNVSFEQEFDNWKRQFKRDPKSVNNPFLQKIGIKCIDQVSPEMLLKEYNDFIDSSKRTSVAPAEFVV